MQDDNNRGTVALQVALLSMMSHSGETPIMRRHENR